MTIETLEALSANRLGGQPVPDDLGKLFVHRDALLERYGWVVSAEPEWQPWNDTSYLSEDEWSDPTIAANVEAMAATNRLIAFVADADGEGWYGYWRGVQNRSIAESPIVHLDTEGQYGFAGASFMDALLLAWGYESDQFDEAKSWLGSIGIAVPYTSWRDVPEGLCKDWSNDYRERIYESL